MRKKALLVMTIFFLASFELNAFSQKEKIQETLTKIGIKQEIIDETIKLDFEIRDTLTFENDENIINERVKKLENLLEKDKRNYIVSEALITIFESKISQDYEKYLDLFVKYTPYEYSKIFSKMVYYRGIGNVEEVHKYMNQLEKMYKDKPVWELIKLYQTEDVTEREIQTRKVLKLLEKESFRKEVGLSDEAFYFMKLTYYLNRLKDYYNKGEIEKGVEEYLKEVAFADVNKEVEDYNLRAEVILFFNVTIMNEEIQNIGLREENAEKLSQTRISKRIQEETDKDGSFLEKIFSWEMSKFLDKRVKV